MLNYSTAQVRGSGDKHMLICVSNLKGGTGKTTSAVYLADGLARRDRRVLLVDADPQGSAQAWAAQLEGWPVVTVGMAQPVLHRQLPELSRGYDDLVVDCPPQHEAIVRSALLVADVVVMPMAPSLMDLDRLKPTLEMLADVAIQHEASFTALLTRVRARTRMSAAARQWLVGLDVPVLRSEIPLREVYAQGLGARPAAGTDYDQVLEELCA